MDTEPNSPSKNVNLQGFLELVSTAQECLLCFKYLSSLCCARRCDLHPKASPFQLYLAGPTASLPCVLDDIPAHTAGLKPWPESKICTDVCALHTLRQKNVQTEAEEQQFAQAGWSALCGSACRVGTHCTLSNLSFAASTRTYQ